MSKNDECVRVVVRCRPLNSKENADGRQKIVDMDPGTGTVTLRSPKAEGGEPPKSFTFDSVFDERSSQREIYDKAARPIVASAMEGYNGTIFAYGQTGTGKTHTMDGQPTPDGQGIIPNSFDHVFSVVEGSEAGVQWMVRASFLEIYNEEVRAHGRAR